MMIKKICLMTLAALAMIATSCKNKSEDPNGSVNYTFATNVLVTPLSAPNQAYAVSNTQYRALIIPGGTGSIALSPISFGEALPDFSFKGEGTCRTANIGGYEGMIIATVYRITIPEIHDGSNSITSLNCVLTDGFWDDEYRTVGASVSMLPVISYTINGKWNVRSFPTNACYAGITNISKDGTQVATYTKTSYVVSLDLAKKKANVKIINPDMNLNHPGYYTVWLRGLDLEYTSTGYAVSGIDVIPECQNGTAWDKLPEQTLSSFRMDMPNSKPTCTNISFTTLNGYTGSLTEGNYLIFEI